MQIIPTRHAGAAAAATTHARAAESRIHLRAGREGEITFTGPRDAEGPTTASYDLRAGSGRRAATVAMTAWRTAVLERMLAHAMQAHGRPNSTADARFGADAIRVLLDPDTSVRGDEQAWRLDPASAAGDHVAGSILTGIAYIDGDR